LWKEFKNKYMTSQPITANTIINDIHTADTLFDDGCLVYGILNLSYVRQLKLKRIQIEARQITGIGGEAGQVREIVKAYIDIGGHKESAFFYVFKHDLGYDLIFGRPWMIENNVTTAPAKNTIYIHRSGARFINSSVHKKGLQLTEVGAVAFLNVWKNSQNHKTPTNKRA
jgi:hypothetical protein